MTIDQSRFRSPTDILVLSTNQETQSERPFKIGSGTICCTAGRREERVFIIFRLRIIVARNMVLIGGYDLSAREYSKKRDNGEALIVSLKQLIWNLFGNRQSWGRTLLRCLVRRTITFNASISIPKFTCGINSALHLPTHTTCLIWRAELHTSSRSSNMPREVHVTPCSMSLSLI